jgi:hypothetical protein
MTKLEQDSLEDGELLIQTRVFDKWRIDDEEDYVPVQDLQLFHELRQKVRWLDNLKPRSVMHARLDKVT